MDNPSKIRALIYCRVSSDRQAKEGHGLDSQEHRCREYARTKGYEVESVFRDSFTGGGDFMLRPAMQELITYADDRPHRVYVVIFDDLSRFARDVVFHLKLRQTFAARGLTPQCLNFNFDDSPEGEMVEIMMAAQNQYHRKNNRRQVIQKMKARMQAGYWPHFSPAGYQQIKDPMHGKILQPLEPQASLLREAFEGFASDRFLTQADVTRFLNASNYSKNSISQDRVRLLLRKVVYAGYVESKEWEVPRTKGKHEGLISLETFENVQAKLDGRGKVQVRKSDSLDFPLRGFLLCSFCQQNQTSSWSTGRNGRFRYYRCKTPSCVRYNKSVRGDKVDMHFTNLLRSSYPKPGAIRLAKVMATQLWSKKMQNLEAHQKSLVARLEQARKQVEVLADRAVHATNDRAVRIYEEQIAKYSSEGDILQDKVRKLGTRSVSFETALETVFAFLENPLVIWEKPDINAKRLVLKLVFAEKLAFHPQFGFETAQRSPFISIFEQLAAKNSQDVEMGGIEPPCNEVLFGLLRSLVRL
jgi:site-specific DNA recombinase